MFERIQRPRASGEIVAQIERAIFGGQVSPGDRLQSERELAEQFGVSRITVRDALRILEARGLIRVKVGASGGAFVSEANVDRVAESLSTMIRLKRMTLSELAEARKVVESATVVLAAQRATASDLTLLQETVERGHEVERALDSHLNVSMDFHVALARAADNEVLFATVRAYHELLVGALRDMRDPKSAKVTQKFHEEIFDAVRSHDAEAAGEIMVEHLAESEKRLRRWLQTTKEGRARAETAVPFARERVVAR
jgi:DNA-binding FadR family transcriptional regulator